jgi:hypothetical protein
MEWLRIAQELKKKRKYVNGEVAKPCHSDANFLFVFVWITLKSINIHSVYFQLRLLYETFFKTIPKAFARVYCSEPD